MTSIYRHTWMVVISMRLLMWLRPFAVFCHHETAPPFRVALVGEPANETRQAFPSQISWPRRRDPNDRKRHKPRRLDPPS